MRLIFLVLILSFPIYTDVSTNNLKKIQFRLYQCGIDYPKYSSLPIVDSGLYLAIQKSKNQNLSKNCLEIIEEIEELLLLNNYDKKNSLEFSFISNEEIFLKDSSNKFFYKENVSFSHENSLGNINYKINLIKTNDSTYFDDSYIRILTGNSIITFGRQNLWWSPSDYSSLIISNQSRALPMIMVENNLSIPTKYFGKIRYKFFLSELEENRFVPNAKLLGLRIESEIKNNLILGLSRVAQFGGDGRDADINTLLNILIGRDNTGDEDEDPSNQIASVDFKYFFKNRTNIYGQIAGEDEAGYLPSRTFYNIGSEIQTKNFIDQIVIDYTDTAASGNPNYTYNHFVYKDGYRYKGVPIGSNIDADSSILNLVLKKDFSFHNNLSIKIFDGKINTNNSAKNYLTKDFKAYRGFSTEYSVKFQKNMYLRIRYDYYQKHFNDADNQFFLNLTHTF